MKRATLLLIFAGAALFVIVALVADPLYRLSIRLSWSAMALKGIPWESGMSSLPITAPASATAEQIHEREFSHSTDRTIEERRVPVFSMLRGLQLCPAMLVDHNGQRWIYLFYWRNGAWTMKMFEP